MHIHTCVCVLVRRVRARRYRDCASWWRRRRGDVNIRCARVSVLNPTLYVYLSIYLYAYMYVCLCLPSQGESEALQGLRESVDTETRRRQYSVLATQLNFIFLCICLFVSLSVFIHVCVGLTRTRVGGDRDAATSIRCALVCVPIFLSFCLVVCIYIRVCMSSLAG